MIQDDHPLEAPGEGLDLEKAPGHWLLARMGKRVLRPGGLEITRRMLEGLAIGPRDHVVEFAPGLGTTTRIVLANSPASYVGVERDEAAARAARRALRPGDQVRVGVASSTGLDAGTATVVFGEAMLTMQTPEQKTAIVREAHRLLREGGRYGIHELALVPDDLPAARKDEIQSALSRSIHVGARPLTVSEWKQVLAEAGFEVESSATAPMHLLEPRRLVADEGVFGALRIAFNVARTPAARQRVRAMRSVFRTYAANLCAVAVVARKGRAQAP